MNYKGIQLPLTSYDSNTGNYFKKLYTVVDVTFDPCIVTFDNGAKVPWNHTKEEFDLYIETLKFPSVKEYLNELLKDKLIFMSKQWWRFEKLDNAIVTLMNEEQEHKCYIEDIFNCRIKDDLHNSKC